MARAGLRRPALQILITAHLMSDLKVRPPKEKSRFLTPPKCGGFGMTTRIEKRRTLAFGSLGRSEDRSYVATTAKSRFLPTRSESAITSPKCERVPSRIGASGITIAGEKELYVRSL